MTGNKRQKDDSMSVSPIKRDAIKGFIQAGGLSSRMGRDKAWMEIGGSPMIERVLTAMRPVIDKISIVVNSKNLRRVV